MVILLSAALLLCCPEEAGAQCTVTITSQTNVNCHGDATGSVTVSAANGMSPYQYSLDGVNYQSSGTFSGLAAGSYTIRARDAIFRLAEQPVVITQPAILSATLTSTPVTCNGAGDGTITVSSPVGGSGTWEVSINGSTWHEVTAIQPYLFGSLGAATYQAWIRDQAHPACIIDLDGIEGTIVTQPPGLSASVTIIQPGCYGTNNGIIAISASGGYGAYEYSIDGGASWTASASNTGLAPGEYDVTVRDSAHPECQVDKGLSVLAYPAILSATLASTPVTCFGASDGTITMSSPSGGYGTYEYSINGGASWQPGGNFTGLGPSTYIVMIRDATHPDCSIILNGALEIVQPAVLAFDDPTITQVSCSGENDGIIMVSTSGGTGNISFSINPSTGNQLPSGTFTNLTAQVYSITATDQNGCMVTTAVTVGTIPDLTPPIISGCPGNLTFYTSPAGNSCSSSATWTEPTASDDCTDAGSLTWTKSQQPGATFPVGSTVVTYTVKDLYNNSASCTFLITVVDNTPPVFVAPLDITVYTNLYCSTNTNPEITGFPANLADNCTPAGSLIVSYIDGTLFPRSCNGLYHFTRTWMVTDAAGNAFSRNQLITVADATKPVLTRPSDISILCGQSTLPANTGTASAVDNCGGTVEITYTDNVTSGTCAGNFYIARTWKAIDCSGNFSTSTQNISITDVSNPVIINVQDLTVNCPSDIPAPDPSVVTATDNCGPVSIALYEEIPHGLEGKPGYCPTSVTRIFRVTDPCGNYADATQTITVLGPCGCSPCTNGTEFYLIDLDGSPTGTQIIAGAGRGGLCCDAANPKRCISFNVRLDVDAVGIEILINGASPDFKEWKIDCTDISIIGNIVCMPGGGFHLFTFCKEGSNVNDFTFRSVAGVVASQDIIARVDCQGQLTASGIVNSPVWTSVSPGTVGQYDKYLSCTECMNPVFTADSLTPPIIKYQICGNIGSTICVAAGMDCDTITIFIKEKIDIDLNLNTQLICKGIPATISAVISPAANYTYEWFTGFNASGVPFSTASSFSVSIAGQYSVRATDTQDGIPCSSAVYNFIVDYDMIGPTVLAPPGGDLIINCNDPNAPQLISDWLASASGTYIKSDGTVVTLVPENDYAGNLLMACGSLLPVTFTALDACGNATQVTVNIRIADTIPPSWITIAGALDRTVSCSDPAGMEAAQALHPNAADNCDISLTPLKTAGSLIPGMCSGSGTITNTWTATDACGNTSTLFSQVITVVDVTPPVITFCPADITGYADNAECFATGILLGTALATDDCSTPVVTSNAPYPIPVGIRWVTWTAVDACGNIAICTQKVTILDNNQPPDITCPAPVVQTALPNNCALNDVIIPDPVSADNCRIVLQTWSMSGKTTGSSPATGIHSVSGQTFNVGHTTVTYTVADSAGNSSSCFFDVWIKDLMKPEFSFGCPGNIIQDADPGRCSGFVNAPVPEVYDPCNELISIVNSFNGTDNASGDYPIGTTLVTWTITDLSGNINTCVQEIKINDIFPALTCPPHIIANADFNLPYASGVEIGTPVYSDNCPGFTLTWVSSDPTPGTSPPDGININTASTFNTGVTTIIYTLTDTHNHSITCSFSVTVLAKVAITCPADTILNSDAGLCTATFNPGSPVKVSGVDPVTWEWLMTGATSASGTSNPLTPNPFIFNTGITRITWTATNISGTDTCTQIITVIDDQPPSFDPAPKSFCVENILQADFNPSSMDIEPYRPEFFTFTSGNTSLDLTGIHDNCCSPPDNSIHWRIDFTPTPDPYPPHDPVNTASISGEGQPSGFGDISLPGDGVTFLDVIHRITYWLTDCHGNNSSEKSADITIKPRPQIIKN